jgi:hypothetical protein
VTRHCAAPSATVLPRLPGWEIDAQAAITLPLSHFTAAIARGTGVYKGVSGQILNTVVSPPEVIDRTLRLIFASRDH